MKNAIIAIAGFVLAGLLSSTTVAYARQVPQGSYAQSCRDIRMVDGTLLAFCRQPDGRWDMSALARVGTCVGDIGNKNGVLACNRGPLFGSGRRPARWEHERRLGCEGIVDPIARGRCRHGF